jgi:dTDP-4-dehydrorhamnose reductase
MKIAILGTSGMLGDMVLKVFSETTDYNIVATCRNTEYFKNYPNVEYKILDAQTSSLNEIDESLKDCKYIINCIGIIKTEINEKTEDIQKAIEVNSLFPFKLNALAKLTGSTVIQIATDCVYDGKKGFYSEQDQHNALDVYGKTKSLGEIKSPNFVNLRCSIIGPELKNKKSLLEWFLNQPQNVSVKGFENHKWNGVTTYHFAQICKGIVQNDLKINNLQHVIPKDIVSKAEMLEIFAEVFNRKDLQINNVKTDLSIDRTISTINTSQNKLIWEKAGYDEIPTVTEMLHELKLFMGDKNV